MAGRSLSGSCLEATPHVHGVGNAPVLFVCEGVADVAWASRLHLGRSHTGGRVNAWSGTHVGNRGKSLFRSHSSYTPSSGKPSKQYLSTQAGGFGGPCGLLTLLGACHSGEGGLITPLGLGLGLGGLNRGPRLAEVTVGRCRLTASLYYGGNFARSAYHYHSPSIRGAACRRQLSTTLGVDRLSTVGVIA